VEATTLKERLQLLRDRYPLFLGPLVLLLGVGIGSSPLLAWTAGVILLAITINKLVPALSRQD